MISTSARGSASFASTQARAGRFLASTHALHTSFIGARLRMSVTQICACRTFDLCEPHLPSRRSISSSTSFVCPLTSFSRPFATMPARYTVLPCSTACERMLLGSWRTTLISAFSSLCWHWILDVRRFGLLAGRQVGLRRRPCRAELLDIGVHGTQVFVAGLADAPPWHRRARLQVFHIGHPVALAHGVDVDAQVRRVCRAPRPTPALRAAALQPVLLGHVAFALRVPGGVAVVAMPG